MSNDKIVSLEKAKDSRHGPRAGLAALFEALSKGKSIFHKEANSHRLRFHLMQKPQSARSLELFEKGLQELDIVGQLEEGVCKAGDEGCYLIAQISFHDLSHFDALQAQPRFRRFAKRWGIQSIYAGEAVYTMPPEEIAPSDPVVTLR